MAEKEIDPNQVYKDKIIQIIDEFREKLIKGTSSSEDFMTISQIEQLWGQLKGDTSLLYSDMLQEILSQANEAELIRKKKPNIEPKGSNCEPTNDTNELS